jgi:hypothetical protein
MENGNRNCSLTFISPFNSQLMRGAASVTADRAAFPFYARRMGPVRALCLCRIAKPAAARRCGPYGEGMGAGAIRSD